MDNSEHAQEDYYAVPYQDDRTERTHARLRRKLEERKRGGSGGLQQQPGLYNDLQHHKRNVSSSLQDGTGAGSPDEVMAMEPARNGFILSKDDEKNLKEMLSRVQPPAVSGLGPREAHLSWRRLDGCTEASEGAFPEIEASAFTYDVAVAERTRDAKYTTVYRGPDTECGVWELKPATEYFVRLCALLQEYSIVGDKTTAVGFCTKATRPDKPPAPRVYTKTKTMIHLKWNAAPANGSPITTYFLEYETASADIANGGLAWSEIYCGKDKTYKVQRLAASTPYRFRIAAANDLGKSEYSEVLHVSTTGQAPTVPDIPALKHKSANEIALAWKKRPEEDAFELQMQDPDKFYFQTIYNGPETSYIQTCLYRNHDYNFRLRSRNDDGDSGFSDVITVRTDPEAPCSPGKPTVKGRIHTTGVRLVWDPPKDRGGGQIETYTLEQQAAATVAQQLAATSKPHHPSSPSKQGGHNKSSRGGGDCLPNNNTNMIPCQHLWSPLYTGPDTEFNVTGLQPGQLYHFRVVCVSSGGRSGYSDILSVTTLPVAPGPCKSVGLYSKPKPNSVHIKWTEPEKSSLSDISSFDIETTQTSSAEQPQSNNAPEAKVQLLTALPGTRLDATIPNLLPGRRYGFRVRAHNSAGAGAWSDTYEAKTGAGPPEHSRQLTATPRGPTTIYVTWLSPSSDNGMPISEYRLQQAFKRLTDAEDAAHELRSSPCDSSDSPPGSSDMAKSLNAAGDAGSNSAAMSVASGGGSESGSSSVISSRPASRSTSSSATSSPAHHRHHQHSSTTPPSKNSGGGSLETIGEYSGFTTVYTGSALATELRTLSPATAYVYRVQAVNSVGASRFSKLETCQTPPGPPASVPNVSVDILSTSELTVIWDEPDNNGSRITGYCLDISPPCSSFTPPDSTTSAAAMISRARLASSGAGGDAAVSGEGGSSTEQGAEAERDHGDDEDEEEEEEESRDGVKVPPPPPASVAHGANSSSITIHDAAATQYTISDLLPETTYRIRVQALNNHGAGVASSTVRTTTFGLPPPPPFLECAVPGHNSLKLKWTSGDEATLSAQQGSSGMATSTSSATTLAAAASLNSSATTTTGIMDQVTYSLEIENKSGSFSPVYEGTNHSHKVPRLNECTTYKFRIRATSSTGGTGSWSDPVTFSTTRSPPPPIKGSPRITEVREKCCRIEWSATKVTGLPASDKCIYQLQLQNTTAGPSSRFAHPSSGDDFKTVYQGPDTSYSLSGLPSGSSFRVRVCLVRLSNLSSAASSSLSSSITATDDTSNTTYGPYSNATSFSTPSQHSSSMGSSDAGYALRTGAEGSLDASDTDMSQGGWSETHKAVAILAACSLLAILVAVIVQWAVDGM